MSPAPEAHPVRRYVPALAGGGFFLLIALLSLVAQGHLYRSIGKIWGIDVWEFPFLDTDTVLSAVRCIRQGVDVYVANPCDPLGRVFDYSPLWMVLRVFPMTLGWLGPIGLIVDLAFLASLALLPAGRTRRDTVMIALGVIASATFFAVERANNDLLLFVLAAGAAVLVTRSDRLRFVAYALALLAGLLKYYPMTLMAIAARERPAKLLAVTAATLVTAALFVAVCRHDLARALHLIPTGSYFGDMFGSITVGGALAERGLIAPALRDLLRWGMTATAMVVALAWGLRGGLADQLGRLDRPERAFLMAGALLTVGCFFSAQNIGYRAVHLILTLPALTALRSRKMAIVALAILWSEGWRHALRVLGKALGPYGLDITTWASWLLREALWWSLVTFLLSCIVAWLARSTAARDLFPRLGGGSPSFT